MKLNLLELKRDETDAQEACGGFLFAFLSLDFHCLLGLVLTFRDVLDICFGLFDLTAGFLAQVGAQEMAKH